MGKRKQTVPQRTTEEKRQCMTWNMLDGNDHPQTSEMTIVPDNDPSLLTEQQLAAELQTGSKKSRNETTETNIGYKNDDLKDIFDLHKETCLFHLTGHINLLQKEDDWLFEIAKLKVSFSPGPLFLPLPIDGLPVTQTETCTLWISAEGEKSILSFERFLEKDAADANLRLSESSKKKGKSKSEVPKEILFWLVDVDLPLECLMALKCKTILLVIDNFDKTEMSLSFKIVGTEAVVSELSFPSEAVRPRQHNLSLKTLMSYFYRISEPSYDGLTYNKKHDINQLYSCIKERHQKQSMQYLPGIQHEKLLPKLRPYQKAAITWMVNKEKSEAAYKENLDLLFTEFKSLDGKNLFYNKYTGIVVKDRPCSVSNPAGGILADEMGLGKTVEVLGCMLHNQRETIKLPELLPIIEDEPTEDVKSKREKNKKKKKEKKKITIDTDSDDSNSTVIYTEDLIEKSLTDLSADLLASSTTDQNENNSNLADAVGCDKKNIFTEQPKSHSGEFECICGSEEFQAGKRRQKRKHTVQCVKCGLLQHAECVNYDVKDPYRGEFMCPHCHVESMPVPSGATLIISPFSIADQWVEEILKHVVHQAINVFMYTGVNKQGFIQPQTLARQDIVITTYETLRKEIDYVDLPHSNSDTGRRLRHPKRFMAIPSPIIAVEWWRICLDEAQMVECTTTKTAEMALRLSAVNRWCVTGTPIQKSVEDLYGLLLFLGVAPFWVQPWWNKLVYEPFCHGVTEPMYVLLTSVMWRTMKRDVLNQIDIPPQYEETNWLTFSPVEDHFYRRQYRDCLRLSMERLGKWTDSSTRLSSLDRHTVNQLLYPLLRLRQACCHPQAVRGEFLPIQKTTMTMEELLESLTKKAKLEAEESHRLLIAAINGQAGLCIIQEQFVDAVDRYREVLRSIEEQKDMLHTDKLQQLHAMFNLHEILQSKPQGVAPTLRDDQLTIQIQELKDKYLAKAIAYVKETGDALSSIQFEVKQLQRDIHDGSEWWLEIILWAVQRDLDETLVLKIKDDLLENTDNTIRTALRSCRNSTGLRYVMHSQLAGIESAYNQVLKVMTELDGEPSQDLINKTVECCLRPVDEVLKNCPFCKSEELFEAYEAKLFFFVEKGIEVGGVNGGYSVNVNRQGTWADSEAEKALKTILGFAKGCRVDPELIEYGNTHIKLLDAMKKEYKKLRTHWAGIKEHVASFDELDMSTTRLRLRLPDEPVPENPQLNVLEKSELTQHKLKLVSDRIVGQGELRKKMGQLLYLKNLAKTQSDNEDGENPELCPICQQELGKEWSVMQCGHCFCLECIRILVDRASFGRQNFSVKCAVCRQSTHQGEISYVTTKRTTDTEDGSHIWVKGSHSTKVEAVVRCLLKIKQEDPMAKTLVFSTWTDVLSVIATALEENSIPYVPLYTSGKFQHNLAQFKQSEEGTTLLIPVHSGANGLNLIEATHVILVEPILNPAQEQQAIGRVHRIGQTRPTKVHRFLIRGTIEQKMHVLIKSLDTHGLSKNTEDSVLTIGDLSSLFTQQSDNDTDEVESSSFTGTQSTDHQENNQMAVDTIEGSVVDGIVPSTSGTQSVNSTPDVREMAVDASEMLTLDRAVPSTSGTQSVNSNQDVREMAVDASEMSTVDAVASCTSDTQVIEFREDNMNEVSVNSIKETQGAETYSATKGSREKFFELNINFEAGDNQEVSEQIFSGLQRGYDNSSGDNSDRSEQEGTHGRGLILDKSGNSQDISELSSIEESTTRSEIICLNEAVLISELSDLSDQVTGDFMPTETKRLETRSKDIRDKAQGKFSGQMCVDHQMGSEQLGSEFSSCAGNAEMTSGISLETDQQDTGITIPSNERSVQESIGERDKDGTCIEPVRDSNTYKTSSGDDIIKDTDHEEQCISGKESAGASDFTAIEFAEDTHTDVSVTNGNCATS